MIPRVVIAGTSSGAGKTTVATGLMAALRATLAAFKVGPDFIDPSYHALATGRPGPQPRRVPVRPRADRAARSATARKRRRHRGHRGRDGALRRRVRPRRAGLHRPRRQAAAGAGDPRRRRRRDGALGRRDRPRLPHVRPRRERRGRDPQPRRQRRPRATSCARRCPDVPVLGALPRDAALEVPERHLGLVPGRRARAARARRDRAPRRERRGALRPRGASLALARSAPRRCPARPGTPATQRARARAIAIARGPAFSFHYEENLELLRGAGAELRRRSTR